MRRTIRGERIRRLVGGGHAFSKVRRMIETWSTLHVALLLVAVLRLQPDLSGATD